MKKIVCLLIVLSWGTCAFAQTKNGTVYSEHEDITKTREMWKAFETGDAETFISFFADSVYRVMNGTMSHIPKERFKGNVDYWKKNFKNLKIADNKPAYPDAIEYKKGGTWVQDWLLFTGTHTETGINIAIPYHNLYSFNDEGKITSIHFYFPSGVFEEINNSSKTIENGKIYINHPYIVKVRKAVNAYCDKDLDALLEFYDEKASFSDLTKQWDDTFSLEDAKKGWTEDFAKYKTIKLKQRGYPDCIHYDKGGWTVVYSWWTWMAEEANTNKKYEVPVMMSDYFNEDGKIVMQHLDFSTNHFE